MVAGQGAVHRARTEAHVARHAAIRSEADYARIPIGSFPVTVIQPAAGHPMSPAR